MMKKLSKINENVFDDMLKRGQDGVARREDDVDLFKDIVDFLTYLQDLYAGKHHIGISGAAQTLPYMLCITVPYRLAGTKEVNGRTTFSFTEIKMVYNNRKKKYLQIAFDVPENDPGFLDTVKSKYNVDKAEPVGGGTYGIGTIMMRVGNFQAGEYCITPDDGEEITNSFCIGVIDFFLANVRNPELKKRIR